MRGICRYGFLGSTSLGIHSDRNSYGHNYLNRKSFRTQLCKGFSRLMTIEIISMYTSSQVQVTHPKPLEEKELSCYFLIQALRHSKDSEKVKKKCFQNIEESRSTACPRAHMHFRARKRHKRPAYTKHNFRIKSLSYDGVQHC
jgi:hypothetical protein